MALVGKPMRKRGSALFRWTLILSLRYIRKYSVIRKEKLVGQSYERGTLSGNSDVDVKLTRHLHQETSLYDVTEKLECHSRHTSPEH